MSIFAALTTLIFLPTQFYFIGLFLKPSAETVLPAKTIEETTDSKSFREAITEPKKNEATPKESGFLPQRKPDYANIEIAAGTSLVVDVDSGTILRDDKGRDHMPIASLTKIMTATVVMEKVPDLNEVVTIDKEALSADGAKVGCPTSVLSQCTSERLRIGEKITVHDLLTAMLIDSANDAAVALGKYVAGSQKAFADMMNAKADELNLEDSHFCNPSGLDVKGCYSSAYDLARIAAYSMKYDTLWKIMNTQEDSVKSCDGKYEHLLKNTDMLLGQIPNCLGGKTGFTYSAGESLMLAATDPETGRHKIIAVILNDSNRWKDMQSLIDWTFNNYEWK